MAATQQFLYPWEQAKVGLPPQTSTLPAAAGA